MESVIEKKKINLDLKLVWFIIIFLSIGVIVGVCYLIVNEIQDAKKHCESIEGDYNLNEFKHYCNGKEFIKKSFCWAGKCEARWGFEFNASELLR